MTFGLFIGTMKGLLEQPDTSYLDIINTWQLYADNETWLFALSNTEYQIFMDFANLIFSHFGMETIKTQYNDI